MKTKAQATDPGLAEYLEMPVTPAAPGVVRELEEPCDPADALPLAEIDRLLDPSPLKVENGWCRLEDGSGFAAARTEMPGLTAEMVDWWFDWHPRVPERYVAWHPVAHQDNRLEPAKTPGAKAHWGTVHHAVEDVGSGTIRARINFLPPTGVGFSTDALDDDRIGTIAAAYVGDARARHTVMAHVFFEEPGGLTLRSHFWIGSVIRPNLPGPLAGLVGPAMNNSRVRRLMIPDAVPENLARHCAEEYTHLATILPPLYAEFGDRGEK